MMFCFRSPALQSCHKLLLSSVSGHTVAVTTLATVAVAVGDSR